MTNGWSYVAPQEMYMHVKVRPIKQAYVIFDENSKFFHFSDLVAVRFGHYLPIFAIFEKFPISLHQGWNFALLSLCLLCFACHFALLCFASGFWKFNFALLCFGILKTQLCFALLCFWILKIPLCFALLCFAWGWENFSMSTTNFEKFKKILDFLGL